MNIEELKLVSNKELIEYGKTIPLGRRYDSNNNIIEHKNWDDTWYKKSYDSNNNLLTFINSLRYYRENTYDSTNNQLTYINSHGVYYKKTYDSNNKKLTHKDSSGANFELLCIGQEYNLLFDKNKKLYMAGCRKLNYDDCIGLYNKQGEKFIDAELFMNAIHKNEKNSKINQK